MKSMYILILVSVLGLASCDDGAGENMGERLDDAATDIGNAVEDACEEVKDAAGADNKNC